MPLRNPNSVKNIKEAVRQRDDKCSRCGITRDRHFARWRRDIEVHRIVPGSPYTVDGCKTFCARCHRGYNHAATTPDDRARLSIKVPVSLRKRFDALAAARGRTIAAEGVAMVEWYCAVEEAKLPGVAP